MSTTTSIANPHSLRSNMKNLRNHQASSREKNQILKELRDSVDFLINQNTADIAKKFFSGRYMCPFHGKYLEETNSEELARAIVLAVCDPGSVREACFIAELLSQEIKGVVVANIERKLSSYVTVTTRNAGIRTYFSFIHEA